MAAVFRRRSGRSGPSADEQRESNLESIKRLAERFVYDLGLLMAGHAPALEEYVEPAVATRLRAALEPFLASGDAMRPNFGEYGELRVHGELLDIEAPVRAAVEFDDQSVRETASGDLLPSTRSRMRVMLTIDPGLEHILEVTVERIATPTPA